MLLQGRKIVRLTGHKLWVIGKFRRHEIVIESQAAQVRSGAWIIRWGVAITSGPGIHIWAIAWIYHHDWNERRSIGNQLPRAKIIGKNVPRNSNLEIA